MDDVQTNWEKNLISFRFRMVHFWVLKLLCFKFFFFLQNLALRNGNRIPRVDLHKTEWFTFHLYSDLTIDDFNREVIISREPNRLYMSIVSHKCRRISDIWDGFADA